MQYIDIDSTYRDRNLYPNPTEFVVQQDYISGYGDKRVSLFSNQVVLYPNPETNPYLYFYRDYLRQPTGEVRSSINLPLMYSTDKDTVIQLEPLVLNPTSIDDIDNNIPTVENLGESNNFYTGKLLENVNTGETRRITDFIYQSGGTYIYQSGIVKTSKIINNEFFVYVDVTDISNSAFSNITNYYVGKTMNFTNNSANIIEYIVDESNTYTFKVDSILNISNGSFFQITNNERWFAEIESPFSTTIPSYPCFRNPIPNNREISFSTKDIYNGTDEIRFIEFTKSYGEDGTLGILFSESNGTTSAGGHDLGDIYYIPNTDLSVNKYAEVIDINMNDILIDCDFTSIGSAKYPLLVLAIKELTATTWEIVYNFSNNFSITSWSSSVISLLEPTNVNTITLPDVPTTPDSYPRIKALVRPKTSLNNSNQPNSRYYLFFVYTYENTTNNTFLVWNYADLVDINGTLTSVNIDTSTGSEYFVTHDIVILRDGTFGVYYSKWNGTNWEYFWARSDDTFGTVWTINGITPVPGDYNSEYNILDADVQINYFYGFSSYNVDSPEVPFILSIDKNLDSDGNVTSTMIRESKVNFTTYTGMTNNSWRTRVFYQSEIGFNITGTKFSPFTLNGIDTRVCIFWGDEGIYYSYIPKPTELPVVSLFPEYNQPTQISPGFITAADIYLSENNELFVTYAVLNDDGTSNIMVTQLQTFNNLECNPYRIRENGSLLNGDYNIITNATDNTLTINSDLITNTLIGQYIHFYSVNTDSIASNFTQINSFHLITGVNESTNTITFTPPIDNFSEINSTLGTNTVEYQFLDSRNVGKDTSGNNTDLLVVAPAGYVSSYTDVDGTTLQNVYNAEPTGALYTSFLDTFGSQDYLAENCSRFIQGNDEIVAVSISGSSNAVYTADINQNINWSTTAIGSTAYTVMYDDVNNVYVAAGTNVWHNNTGAASGTWTAASTIGGISNTLGLAHNNTANPTSIYVAVGNNVIGYSTDLGVNWTLASTIDPVVQYRSVVWDKNLSLFIAVGDGGAISTSSDGDTWTSRTSGTVGNLVDISSSFFLGLLVVVSNTTEEVLTSTDGINWTINSVSFTDAASIVYGNSKYAFVIITDSGDVYYSRDGTIWNSYVFRSSIDFSSISNIFIGYAFDNGVFIINGSNGSTTTRNVSISGDFLSKEMFSGMYDLLTNNVIYGNNVSQHGLSFSFSTWFLVPTRTFGAFFYPFSMQSEILSRFNIRVRGQIVSGFRISLYVSQIDTYGSDTPDQLVIWDSSFLPIIEPIDYDNEIFNKWFHLVLTFERNTVKFYINNVLLQTLDSRWRINGGGSVSTGPLYTANSTNPDTLILGKESISTEPDVSKIPTTTEIYLKDTLLTERYLSPEEINSIYNYSLSSSIPFVNFEILGDTQEIYNPYNYFGTQFGSEDCFELELTHLILPNVEIKTGFGNRIAFYPYVYVQFCNVGMENTKFYSNNPNSVGATFKVPISDTNTPDRKFFINNFSGMKVITKFNPTKPFKVKIFLYNGELLEFVDSDTSPPLYPDIFIQTSITIGFRKV